MAKRTTISCFAFLLLIDFCNSFILQNPSSIPSIHSQKRLSRCLMMAGGFGNKEAKKQTTPPKGSGPKRSANPSVQGTVLSTPAQQAMVDVKQIVDNLDENEDSFWQLIGPLLLSEYNAADIQRVLDFIKFSTGKLPIPDSVVNDKWRPYKELHAFMVKSSVNRSFHLVLRFGPNLILRAGWHPGRAISRQVAVPVRCGA